MKTAAFVAATALATGASAHVTLNPNYGASAGNYFKTDMKIPHGTKGMHTTKLVITIPHGVLKATPHAMPGWDISMTDRDITAYTSHGKQVNKGPSTVTYTAICEDDGASGCKNTPGLDNAHLLEIGMQMKMGCTFGEDLNGKVTTDATIWEDMNTLWFDVAQHVSTPGTVDGNSAAATLHWKATSKGTEGWGANGARPAPYIFVASSSKCSVQTTGSTELGMQWNTDGKKAIVAPPADTESVSTKAEVLSILNEELLTLREELATKEELSAVTPKATSMSSETTTALALGVIGAITGVLGLVGTVVLFVSRTKVSYKQPEENSSKFVELE